MFVSIDWQGLSKNEQKLFGETIVQSVHPSDISSLFYLEEEFPDITNSIKDSFKL